MEQQAVGKSERRETRAKILFKINLSNIKNYTIDRADPNWLILSVESPGSTNGDDESIKDEAIELIFSVVQPDPESNDTIPTLNSKTECHDYYLYPKSWFFGSIVHLQSSNAVITTQIENKGLAPSKMNKIVRFIGDRLSEEIGLEEMANHINLSPFHFVREFKKSVGMTPYRYVIHQRIEKAKELLTQTDLAIADVALDCGFSNQSHLGRLFKQYTGITPKHYRQSFFE